MQDQGRLEDRRLTACGDKRASAWLGSPDDLFKIVRARLAAVCAFTHPCYGTAERAAFCEAVDAWKRVYISVAISPDGLGFAVGSEAVAPGLYARLERGERGGGAEGAWPTWH